MSKNIYKALIIGSLWGIIEATLGYITHMIGISIGWLIWYPIAFIFIYKSYSLTNSYPSVMITAFIASSLKLLNLFFPGRIDYVINPAVAILLEAVSFILVSKRVGNKKYDIFNLAFMGFTYRILYLAYVRLLPENLMLLSQAADITKFVKFMFSETVINILFISSFLFMTNKYKIVSFNKLKDKIRELTNRRKLLVPFFSVSSVVFAIAVTILVR